MVKIQNKSWDSETFNIKVGEFNLQQNLSQNEDKSHFIETIASQLDFDVIYIISKSEICESLVNLKLADKKIIYCKNISVYNCDLLNSQFFISSYENTQPTNQLYKLAFESGKFSRFKLDSNFPDNSFEKLYKIWIDKSVSKEIADDVLVIRDKYDNILGFLTYKIEENICHIGLLGVDPLQQGRGVGTILLNYLEYNMRIVGVKQLSVATQGLNVPACNFYSKNQFKTNTITYIYHLWI